MRDQTLTQPSKTVLIIGVVIAAVFPSVSMAILEVWFPKLHLSAVETIAYSRVVFWCEVLLLWWYAVQYEKQNLLIWKERQSDLLFILKWTVLLFFLVMAASTFSAITRLLGFPEDHRLLKAIARFLLDKPLLVIFISATAGICEEIIFRGFILTRLSLLFKNQYVPIVLSSLLFSAMHYKYHSSREFLMTFLFGLIMAFHYNKYRNIKPLILVHFLFDWFALSVINHFMK